MKKQAKEISQAEKIHLHFSTLSLAIIPVIINSNNNNVPF